jgi:ATP-binding cassette subfamily B (MDR/TAP) protein 1
MYCWWFLIIAGISFVAQVLTISIFTYIGESLAFRLRVMLFEKFLKLHMAFYDIPRNAPGNLATRLAADVNLVQNLTSTVVSVMIQSISSFIAGLTIAFYSSWQVTLVTLAVTPLSIFCSAAQQKLHKGMSENSDAAYKDSAAIITEAVCNMRTVASFGNQKHLMKIFESRLEGPTQAAKRKGHISGAIFGASNFCVFVVYAVAFYAGIYFMNEKEVTFPNMFQAIFGLVFAAFGSGAASAFMPDMGATQNAARGIFNILDTAVLIKNPEGKPAVKKERLEGQIEFRNVNFKYPTRDQQILKGLSFEISAKSKIAIVGPSGCGKSTVIQLLLRFYDADSGEIFIDGVNIKDYDLNFLRQSIGIVSQEPVLFNGTIKYNLGYTKENATMEELREAAKLASALDFIEANDQSSKDDDQKYGKGWTRLVGPKGSQISGGQKQRIAIARAILKKPSMLLLDEATSALDANNEQIVQESLNSIIQNNTTSVTVAHRISTIVDSDDILVFLAGRIVERGNYENLTKKEGIFFRLSKGIPITMQ